MEGRNAVLRSGLRSLTCAVRLEMLASLRRQNSVSQAYGCFLWEGSATRQLAFRCRDFGKRRWSWPLYSISLNRSLEAERGPLVGPDHRQIHKARDAEPAGRRPSIAATTMGRATAQLSGAPIVGLNDVPGKQTASAKQPSPPSSGVPDSFEQRLTNLEDKGVSKPKDIWDKLGDLSGLISGLLALMASMRQTFISAGQDRRLSQQTRSTITTELQTLDSFLH